MLHIVLWDYFSSCFIFLTFGSSWWITFVYLIYRKGHSPAPTFILSEHSSALYLIILIHCPRSFFSLSKLDSVPSLISQLKCWRYKDKHANKHSWHVTIKWAWLLGGKIVWVLSSGFGGRYTILPFADCSQFPSFLICKLV